MKYMLVIMVLLMAGCHPGKQYTVIEELGIPEDKGYIIKDCSWYESDDTWTEFQFCNRCKVDNPDSCEWVIVDRRHDGYVSHKRRN